ncbi:MAG: MmcQ/YjbR family DNA-binding protein, partial [Actinobacteria bacterium]|nr:MmcQ/YjbR family DNA-binding protein [Actinomycetota bacterium]
MASWDDVRQIALALPETSERDRRGSLVWEVRGKVFLWERPLRRADYEALGDAAPEGPVLAARTADEGVKFALVADDPQVFFTTPHFAGFNAVLVRLEAIALDVLNELTAHVRLVRPP